MPVERGNSKSSADPEEASIVLIDGVCHLCGWLVTFIIPRDPLGRFRFAPLQSDIGRRLLEKGGLDADGLDTVVLVEKGEYYTESAAALRILRGLRFPWSAAYLLIAVPAPLRNRLYRYVAKNRYRWFGRDDQCLVPTPDIRRRFL
ncbi:thiol-disulfide oxidoreductase DCC family protein [Paenibacillus sp. URB8-2]|uniref:thiol-disulfide oxidoreductase DCC family protein n=1 Tax=Paenibacillus sp. URB8-2 TaxID=2741301 RepID=UPI0015B97346|nr:thiol-disulfide oxidoreductase DCC family protein [Paenibacillus sp. URB8-2]